MRHMKNPKIQALVADFAAALERLVHEQALATVSQALGPFTSATSTKASAPKAKAKPAKRPAAAAAKKAPAAKPKAAKSSGKRARRTNADLERDAGRILGYVKSHPGQRAEAIKKALGIASNHWALPVALLIQRGSISAKGEKRATSYSAR